MCMFVHECLHVYAYVPVSIHVCTQEWHPMPVGKRDFKITLSVVLIAFFYNPQAQARIPEY